MKPPVKDSISELPDHKDEEFYLKNPLKNKEITPSSTFTNQASNILKGKPDIF